MQPDEELMHVFLRESRELIDNLEHDIVAFEAEPDNKLLLENLVCAFRTLKDDAGLVGLYKFEKVAHTTEEILANMHKGPVVIAPDLILFMLEALDKLKTMHNEITPIASGAAEIIHQKIANEKSTTAFCQHAEKTATQACLNTTEFISEDGAWGLFAENIEVDRRKSATVKMTAWKKRRPPEEVRTDVGQHLSDGKKRTGAQNLENAEFVNRDDVELPGTMINLVGELIRSRNEILQFVPKIDKLGFAAACQRLNLITRDLQECVMKNRTQSAGGGLKQMHIPAHEMARNSHERVAFQTDGQADLILDSAGLALAAALKLEMMKAKVGTETFRPEIFNSKPQSLLLFIAGKNELYALPLAQISRFETFSATALEEAGGMEWLRYRNQEMPVLWLDKFLSAVPGPRQDSLFVVVFRINQNDIGFIVNEVIDVITPGDSPVQEEITQPGTAGTLLLNRSAVRVVDPIELIKYEFPQLFDNYVQKPKIDNMYNRILVVDKSPFMRSIYRSYLEPEGYIITDAETWADAGKMIQFHQFDFVISDDKIPEEFNWVKTEANSGNKSEREWPIFISPMKEKESVWPQNAYHSELEKKLSRDKLLEALAGGDRLI